VFAVS